MKPLLIVTALTATSLMAGNWPAWRGPTANGISTDKNLPVKWSTNENVRWRAPLPERGNSSPIVWGDRVFVTQAVNADNRRTIMCFDRATGKLLWQSGVTYTEREQTQNANPYCSATPVTDGERVIASFGSAGLYCCDMDGKKLWHRELGKMTHMFGNASSPIIHGDLCFFYFGPDEKSRLIALNKRTGDIAWEVQPPKLDPSETQMARGGPGGQSRDREGAGGSEGGRGGRGGQTREGAVPGADGPGRGGRGGQSGDREIVAPGEGGRGGRGGDRGNFGNFGIGNNVAPQIFAQADKDKNGKVSKSEFSGVAELWFGKLDPDKSGKLTSEQFAERFYDAVPPRDTGDGEPQQRRPSRTTGPAFFTAADADKDGSLTSAELKSTFTKWFDQWDAEKTGAITEDQFRDGLNAALPRGNFGGAPGGGQGGRGGMGGGGGPGGSWATPVIIKTAGREELIVNFPGRLAAFDPATGKQLWISKGVGPTIYTTPVWGEETLVASSSGPGGGSALAVKGGGNGELSENDRLWRIERAKSAIGSGVIYQGHLYNISQDGIAQCIESKTGKVIWEERLKGSSARGGSWSSILVNDGKLYIPNQAGDIFVLRASPTFEVLATNSMGEPMNASLAASDGNLFVRTEKALWCISTVK
ncbi:MAG TPA: PQQ-binding-like beta-propeller repeat protein [Verrucomicrobiae bacterium]|nr:PQQ-binding-like beta-propeller repeat protein [Verrucomicrobiae bacterium]